jgi:hypothetical protein
MRQLLPAHHGLMASAAMVNILLVGESLFGLMLAQMDIRVLVRSLEMSFVIRTTSGIYMFMSPMCILNVCRM